MFWKYFEFYIPVHLCLLLLLLLLLFYLFVFFLQFTSYVSDCTMQIITYFSFNFPPLPPPPALLISFPFLLPVFLSFFFGQKFYFLSSIIFEANYILSVGVVLLSICFFLFLFHSVKQQVNKRINKTNKKKKLKKCLNKSLEKRSSAFVKKDFSSSSFSSY